VCEYQIENNTIYQSFYFECDEDWNPTL